MADVLSGQMVHTQTPSLLAVDTCTYLIVCVMTNYGAYVACIAASLQEVNFAPHGGIICSHSTFSEISVVQQLSLQVLQTALQADPLLLLPLSALKPILPVCLLGP